MLGLSLSTRSYSSSNSEYTKIIRCGDGSISCYKGSISRRTNLVLIHPVGPEIPETSIIDGCLKGMSYVLSAMFIILNVILYYKQ